jgi:hypothetical protein
MHCLMKTLMNGTLGDLYSLYSLYWLPMYNVQCKDIHRTLLLKPMYYVY